MSKFFSLIFLAWYCYTAKEDKVPLKFAEISQDKQEAMIKLTEDYIKKMDEEKKTKDEKEKDERTKVEHLKETDELQAREDKEREAEDIRLKKNEEREERKKKTLEKIENERTEKERKLRDEKRRKKEEKLINEEEERERQEKRRSIIEAINGPSKCATNLLKSEIAFFPPVYVILISSVIVFVSHLCAKYTQQRSFENVCYIGIGWLLTECIVRYSLSEANFADKSLEMIKFIMMLLIRFFAVMLVIIASFYNNNNNKRVIRGPHSNKNFVVEQLKLLLSQKNEQGSAKKGEHDSAKHEQPDLIKKIDDVVERQATAPVENVQKIQPNEDDVNLVQSDEAPTNPHRSKKNYFKC